MNALVDNVLRIAEVANSRGLLEHRKSCLHDAARAGDARDVISTRTAMRRVGGARADVSYTFP